MPINKFGKLLASGFERMLAKDSLGKGQQVEGNQGGVSTPCPASQRMEVTLAIWPEDESLTIDVWEGDRQCADGVWDVYEVFGESRCLTRPQPGLSPSFECKKALPVVLKFVKPVCAAGRCGH